MERTLAAKRSGTLVRLRCEYMDNPLGVDRPNPKFSWETACAVDDGDVLQSAYRILVASDESALERHVGDLWDSGRVDGDSQNAVVYGGAELASKSRYWWKARIWDRQGRESAWSEAAYFETGLFRADDWQCRWFNCEYPNGATAVYYERKEFVPTSGARITAARAYIGATGSKANAYELRINGKKIGEDLISPGQTHFRRALYRTFDVTDDLRSGRNAIGILHTRKVIFRLDIRYDDGTSQAIVSDQSWRRLKRGPYIALRYAGGSISEGKGETYDARLAPDGWDMPGYDDSAWGRPIPENGPLLLTAQLQPIIASRTLAPVSISNGNADTYVVDFGQNLFGGVSLTVSGEAGTKITLRYAESIHPDGAINPGSLEAGWLAEPQPQYDEFILRGAGEETYRPTFSCHGFRYVEVAGYPGGLTADRISALVIHSDIENGSAFECASELLNRLQHGAVWSFRSNLVSVPFDCPTRERQGWLGDAHCHAEADALNFDMAAFFAKWFDDIADCQLENGIVPLICPSEGHEYTLDMPWAAAVIFIPWDYFVAYGDKAFLAKHYDVMSTCLGSFRHLLDDSLLLQNNTIFGDWFGSAAELSKTFLATAYYYRCLTLLSKIAGELGETGDAASYSALASRVEAGINAAFLKEGRYYDANSQTANALALYFDFVPSASKPAVLGSLVKDVLSRGTMTVGCLGATAILAALAENGRNDIAYYLATNTNKGCWGYWVQEYASTTALENFSDNYASNNHAFLVGGLSAWFYKHLAGISPLEPGYRRIRVKPFIPDDMEHASAQIHTVRGMVKSRWQKGRTQLVLAVEIPPNATAEVYIPSGDRACIEYERSASVSGHEAPFRFEGNYAVYSVGSGRHEWKAIYKEDALRNLHRLERP
ncbi:family 78 glycoside hydrolase catalytic domain [Paenibacillus methanolicus]|uniref:alpha-L-rhamnosidase n=1 Tax=Paenibacillus methanolicus TaxID=582686 RepID=A0A5S5CK72_9BACL|nr:family 78 glycoside hydrolase catalytic domain [Paenibacillus methanolicus]TYP78971.1 alpha-L-rhamnosidase [Paenibacillus methanolicus]